MALSPTLSKDGGRMPLGYNVRGSISGLLPAWRLSTAMFIHRVTKLGRKVGKIIRKPKLDKEIALWGKVFPLSHPSSPHLHPLVSGTSIYLGTQT